MKEEGGMTFAVIDRLHTMDSAGRACVTALHGRELDASIWQRMVDSTDSKKNVLPLFSYKLEFVFPFFSLFIYSIKFKNYKKNLKNNVLIISSSFSSCSFLLLLWQQLLFAFVCCYLRHRWKS